MINVRLFRAEKHRSHRSHSTLLVSIDRLGAVWTIALAVLIGAISGCSASSNRGDTPETLPDSHEELAADLFEEFALEESACEYSSVESTGSRRCGDAFNAWIARDVLQMTRGMASTVDAASNYDDGCTVLIEDIGSLACLAQYRSATSEAWIQIRIVEAAREADSLRTDPGYTSIVVQVLENEPQPIDFPDPYLIN